MPVYVSTSCMNKDLKTVLDVFSKSGIENIELGVHNNYIKDLNKILGEYNFNFIVHHYFPPPKKQFIVNLASSNEKIRKMSIDQIINSINFCNRHNINYLSIHAGFRADPDIKLKFEPKEVLDYDQSFSIFVDSLKTVLSHAEDSNIELAVENNVISAHNMVNGENRLLLMCESWEFKNLFKEIKSKDLSILLDMGHLKISSCSLNFEQRDFIMDLMKHFSGVHLHENNGISDDHVCLKKGDSVLSLYNKYFRQKQVRSVIECESKSADEIGRLVDLLEFAE